MTRRQECSVCHAKPGERCINTIRPGEPLPGRTSHVARDTGDDGKPMEDD